MITPLEALVFLFDQYLSKETYSSIQHESKICGADIWPTYNELRETKRLLKPQALGDLMVVLDILCISNLFKITQKTKI